MADRSVKVTLRGDVSDFNRAMLGAAASSKGLSKTLDTTDHRMNSLVQTSLALGPALVPIGAAAVPAISGLANQLGFAAVGAGTAMVAFQGVGDALTAVNKYAIDPTDANLKNLAETMRTLGPAGREFVMFLQEMRPAMQQLQNTAQAGLFPGLEAGMTDLMTRLPQVERIIDVVATAMGDIAAEAGADLAGPGWTEFFDFLEREARPTLIQMASTMGNFARGFAELWMAFDPLSDQFSAGFLQMSRDFATWADGLSQTQGFQDFIQYVQDTLPQVGATFGAFANMLLQLLQAAAPVGAAALAVLEPIFDVIAGIANTPIGTTLIALAAGLAAVGRARAIFTAANLSPLMQLSRTNFSTPAAGLTNLGSRIPILGSLTQASRNLSVAQEQLARSERVVQQAYAPFGSGRSGRAAAMVGLDKAQRGVTTSSAAMAAAQRRAALQIGGGAAVVGGLAFAMSDLDDKMGLTNTTTGAMVGLIGGPWGAALGAGIGLAIDFASAQDDIGAAVAKSDAVIADSSLNIQTKMAAVNATLRNLQAERTRILAEGDQVGPKGRVTEANTGAVDTAIAGEIAKRKELKAAAQEALFAEFGLTAGMKGTSQATRDQTAAMLANLQAHNQRTDQLLGAFNAETAYRQALKAAGDQAEKNNAGIRGSSEAALANRSAIGALAGAWNQLADSGGASSTQFKKAKTDFIEAAVGMGVARDKAKQLADQLLHMPKPKLDINTTSLDDARKKGVDVGKSLRDIGDIKPKPKIDVQSNASKQAAATRRALNSIPDEVVNIKVITTRITRNILKLIPFKGGPYEGRKLEPGYAFGGVVPGTPPADPTVDNVRAVGASTGKHIMVRSGEWIVNEPQSRKNDEWLKAINNGLNLGPFPSFAPHYNEGGMVGSANAASPVGMDQAKFASLVGREVGKHIEGATLNINRDGRTLQLTMKRG